MVRKWNSTKVKETLLGVLNGKVDVNKNYKCILTTLTVQMVKLSKESETSGMIDIYYNSFNSILDVLQDYNNDRNVITNRLNVINNIYNKFLSKISYSDSNRLVCELIDETILEEDSISGIDYHIKNLLEESFENGTPIQGLNLATYIVNEIYRINSIVEKSDKTLLLKEVCDKYKEYRATLDSSYLTTVNSNNTLLMLLSLLSYASVSYIKGIQGKENYDKHYTIFKLNLEQINYILSKEFSFKDKDKLEGKSILATITSSKVSTGSDILLYLLYTLVRDGEQWTLDGAFTHNIMYLSNRYSIVLKKNTVKLEVNLLDLVEFIKEARKDYILRNYTSFLMVFKSYIENLYKNTLDDIIGGVNKIEKKTYKTGIFQ